MTGAGVLGPGRENSEGSGPSAGAGLNSVVGSDGAGRGGAATRRGGDTISREGSPIWRMIAPIDGGPDGTFTADDGAATIGGRGGAPEGVGRCSGGNGPDDGVGPGIRICVGPSSV